MANITAETIRQFIASVAPDLDLTALADDTPFDDIELDSIDFFNLLLEVQTYCEIEIPDNGLVTKVIPVQKKVKVYQNLKEQLFRKNEKTGEFVAVEMENLRNLTLQSRPSHVTGVNFEMIVFGHSCGKTKRLDPKEKYDAKTTTMYFNIQREDVKSALQSINFSHHFNNVSYVQALSLQEINYELNKHFGLKNFTF